MSGFNFKVPPLSWDLIDKNAQILRRAFELEDVPCLPVMDLLERVMDQHQGMVRLEVGSRQQMGLTEGETCPTGDFIRLREDVYEEAWAGQGRACFTVAHEIGHWHLHTNITLTRAAPDEVLKPYRASEPQANQYAACLLMPAKFFTASDTISTVASRHGVSPEAASHRLNYLRKKGII